jgi:4-amino-4-deoxy-L-arabinose transferase-like glycosyltransferase
MKKFIKLDKNFQENFLIFIFFLISFFIFISKLDYHYIFTDEILYYQKGVDMLEGIFDNTLQVPPLQKYIAGISFKVFNPDLFLMRLPFAILGFLSSIIIFYIVKKQTNLYYGFLASSLYLFSKVIFDSSRMMMLEPVLHFFWLLFMLFIYKIYSTKYNQKFEIWYYLACGLSLGLALATKITSIILLALIFLLFLIKAFEKNEDITNLIKKFSLTCVSSFAVLFVFYLPQIYLTGLWETIVKTFNQIIDVYLDKSVEGKEHVIYNQIFTFSPWWFYFEAQIKNDGTFITFFKYFFGVFAIFTRNKFSVLWGLLFILSFSFHQFSGIKNIRYISSFEIPLIVLSVWGLYYLLNNLYNVNPKFQKIFIIFIILTTFLNLYTYIISLKHTEYLGVFNYFKNETNNFKEWKRIYFFGSIRTLKYYKKLLPNEHMLTFRRDYEIFCPEFFEYTYFAFDKEDLLKNPDNELYRFVSTHIDNFERVSEIEDMLLFLKVKEFTYVGFCK